MSDELESKDPDVPKTYTIDWTDLLILAAPREKWFDVGEIQRASAASEDGWYFECTVAGKTSRSYPETLGKAWPRAEGETLTDGSAIFVCKHPDNAVLPTVSAALWTVPSGLTLDSQIEEGQTSSLTVSGGEDGQDYDVLCRMTPTAGNVLEQTITIRVRSR